MTDLLSPDNFRLEGLKKWTTLEAFFSLFRDSYHSHDFSWKCPLSRWSLDTFYRIKRKGDHCAMNKIVKPKSDLWQLFWKKVFIAAKSTMGRFSFNASYNFLFQFFGLKIYFQGYSKVLNERWSIKLNFLDIFNDTSPTLSLSLFFSSQSLSPISHSF